MEKEFLYGPDVRDRGWVPAPRYVLRRHRVLAAIDRIKPGSVLEIGCGPGALLFELSRRGIDCTGLETSPEAREMAAFLHGENGVVAFHDIPVDSWEEAYDLVMACEVLEHIEDDKSALATWVRWIRPGGHLLISVPSHQRFWNATDVWAGHFRRYERDELWSRLTEAGLTIERFESYGVPLANIMEPIRARVHQRLVDAREDDDVAAATAQSGTRRSAESKLFPLQNSWPGRVTMLFFIAVQKLFLGTDLGRGYLVIAQKPHRCITD